MREGREKEEKKKGKRRKGKRKKKLLCDQVQRWAGSLAPPQNNSYRSGLSAREGCEWRYSSAVGVTLYNTCTGGRFSEGCEGNSLGERL